LLYITLVFLILLTHVRPIRLTYSVSSWRYALGLLAGAEDDMNEFRDSSPLLLAYLFVKYALQGGEHWTPVSIAQVASGIVELEAST